MRSRYAFNVSILPSSTSDFACAFADVDSDDFAEIAFDKLIGIASKSELALAESANAQHTYQSTHTQFFVDSSYTLTIARTFRRIGYSPPTLAVPRKVHVPNPYKPY